MTSGQRYKKNPKYANCRHLCPYCTMRVSKSSDHWCALGTMSNFEKRNLRSGHLIRPGHVTFGVSGSSFLEMCQIVGWTAMANLAALRAAVFSLSAKNLTGGLKSPPPPVRGLSPHMSLNQQYDFQKCKMSKYDFLMTWPWVWMLLSMSVFEICHPLPPKATGWHWRGHRLLRAAMSEISGLGPKWSFATDTQRILNIRRRISPRWRFWSVASLMFR